MPQIIDGLKDPYGLNGGAILSGSINKKCDAFWYYSVTGTSAIINFANHQRIIWGGTEHIR